MSPKKKLFYLDHCGSTHLGLGKLPCILFYKQADVIVNTELRPQREVVAQVCHQFEESTKGTSGLAEA